MPSNYSPSLVVLSVLIAIFAAYVALDIGGRIASKEHGPVRWAWIATAGLALGGGIWSMHFVGMIALRLPVAVWYGVPNLVLSAAIAIIVSGLAIRMSLGPDVAPELRKSGWPAAIRTIPAAIAMGMAIVGMHYMGMAAIQGPVAITYHVPTVVLSVAIALVVSYVALLLTLHAPKAPMGHVRRWGAASVMGVAVAGMHYTAMHAAAFCRAPITTTTLGLGALSTPGLAIGVAMLTIVTLVLNLGAASVDRRFESTALALALAREREGLLAREQAARRSAEEANRVKLDFLATMSHELRTPLNAIAGYTELLSMGIHGPVTEAQLDALTRIQRSERRLLALINDVLNFAKLDSGSVQYAIGDISLAPVLVDACLLVEPQMRLKGVRYTLGNSHEGLCVRADAEKLGQILINLLSNALKFTDAGGLVSITCQRDAGTVSIAVTDTGIGIPSDKIHLIFEPFVQITSGIMRTQGTGLGLAISRDLARAMGGDLTAMSQPEIGSTFIVTIPAADTATSTEVYHFSRPFPTPAERLAVASQVRNA